MTTGTTNSAAGEPTTASLAQLRLDPANPRLASGLEPGEELEQDELVRRLWDEMSVDEVAFSIAGNGYYQEERLLVFLTPGKCKDAEPCYTVAEGNRRLAAVRLLVDDALRRKVKATDLPMISPEARQQLQSLPVSVYPDKRSLWSYLGFRHINGTRPWDSLSKAKYVAEVFENYGIALDEIARRIGDRHSTVVRLYRGIKILEQAERQSGFDLEDRIQARFAFSHLYTAVQQPEFQRFLGITANGSLKPDPVPKSKLSELSQLMTWLYGRKSSRTAPLIQSQNPDLNTLREVIGKPASLSALRSGLSLGSAYEISIGDERRFREALTRASEELRRAKGTVTTGYEGEQDLMDMVQDIVLLATSIQDEMAGIRAQPKLRRKARIR